LNPYKTDSIDNRIESSIDPSYDSNDISIISHQHNFPKDIPRVSTSKTFDYLITTSNILPS
jgi:hypothetical protein